MSATVFLLVAIGVPVLALVLMIFDARPRDRELRDRFELDVAAAMDPAYGPPAEERWS